MHSSELALPVDLTFETIVVRNYASVVILDDDDFIIPYFELWGLHDESWWALLFEQLLLFLRFVLEFYALIIIIIVIGIHNLLEWKLLLIKLVHKLFRGPTCINWDHSSVSVKSKVLVMDHIKNRSLSKAFRHAISHIVYLTYVNAIKSYSRSFLNHMTPIFVLVQKLSRSLRDVARP